MTNHQHPPKTHKNIRNRKVNKLALEHAELILLKDYELKIRRLSSKQLNSMNKKKRGRPFIYSKYLIEYAAIILYLRNLSYRRLKTEVELRLGIRISKSQLHERITTLLTEINIQGFLQNKLLECSIDSTGFRPTEKGLWRIIKHEDGRIKIRNGYIKLSIINEVCTTYILTAFIGSAQTADITLFYPSLEDIEDYKVIKLYGDGAYDAFSVYKECIKRKITPVIRPSKNSVVYYSGVSGLPRDLRSSYVKAIKESGYKEWSSRNDYGRRWSTETVFSKFKRLFGEVIRSRKEENIRQEFTLKIWIYNMLVVIQHGYKDILFFIRFFFFNFKERIESLFSSLLDFVWIYRTVQVSRHFHTFF